MEEKVQRLLQRLHEVEQLLGHPEALTDQKKYRQLTQEHSRLSEVRECWDDLQRARKQIADSQQILSEETDEEFLALAREEIAQLRIDEEKYQKNEKLLILDNNIEALCSLPCPDYLYKNLTIEGTYDTFIKPRVIANKIKKIPTQIILMKHQSIRNLYEQKHCYP
jgi:hypothetical protein